MLKIKKIDKLLLKEFIPPFVVAFSIAQLVLMMQFLWLYIDDIAGKGVGIFLLAEMIYYMGLSLIPMSLPIAVLLASVMVFGSLAEKYELASLKTAGIPLMRTMRSSMGLAALVALSSFLCSNYVIPYSNLKFRSRLYDIKKQKPALYLESGVFNDDFQGYSIRIGRKSADNRQIGDIMIDDDASNNRNQLNVIRAKDGEMYITPDDKFFVMQMRDGNQYQKVESAQRRNRYPFIRTRFGEWTKVFDLSEFDLDRTDEDLFKSYHAMLNTHQLKHAIDSIHLQIDELAEKVRKDARDKLYYLHHQPGDEKVDSLKPVDGSDSLRSRSDLTPLEIKKSRHVVYTVEQPFLSALKPGESLANSFAVTKRVDLLSKARNIARSSKNLAYEYQQRMLIQEEKLQRHTYQLHSKYGFAMVCFIFLFIGAPMGAIVRKGGFGYPLLIAIVFFMVFVILTKLCEKLSKGYALDPIAAAWLPCAILFPIGLFLTIKAMNDSKMLNIDRLVVAFSKFLNKKPFATSL